MTVPRLIINTKVCERMCCEESKNIVYVTDKRTNVWSRDFIICKINYGLWAVVWAGLWNKRVWADYEQRLRPVFSLFRSQTFCFVLRAQNTTLLSKVRRRFFQILWPSQKTQNLTHSFTNSNKHIRIFVI